jgi:hypothetical protein
MPVHNLLNVLVRTANEMGLQRSEPTVIVNSQDVSGLHLAQDGAASYS